MISIFMLGDDKIDLFDPKPELMCDGKRSRAM